jgi:hypothetical protein
MRPGTRRILTAFSQVDDRSFAEGLAWYPNAHQLARNLADGDVRCGAGVIASLSPQIYWDDNVRLARDAFNDHFHGQVGDAIRKARYCMSGDPDDVLPHGRKTWHFYHTIVDPLTEEHVTVDRHACAIAEGIAIRVNPGRIGHPRYRSVLADYLAAADFLGRPVSEVQAITWCGRRNYERRSS